MRWLLPTILLWTAALTGGPVRPSPAATTMIAATGVRNGEFRAWHPNGRLADVRRYVVGREAGLQQSWTADGVLYLNYEVRNGRRYGLINSRPCLPAEDATEESVEGPR